MASKESLEFNCDCGKAYTNENHFKKHKTFCGKEKVKCVTCQKEYSSNSALKLHQATKHGEKIYSKVSEKTCSFCNKRFQGSYGLNRHIKNFHE